MATRKLSALWMRSLLVIGTLVMCPLSERAAGHSLAQPPDAPEPLLVDASEPADEKGGVTERAVPGVPMPQASALPSTLVINQKSVAKTPPYRPSAAQHLSRLNLTSHSLSFRRTNHEHPRNQSIYREQRRQTQK
jgi:hypothetical protein